MAPICLSPPACLSGHHSLTHHLPTSSGVSVSMLQASLLPPLQRPGTPPGQAASFCFSHVCLHSVVVQAAVLGSPGPGRKEEPALGRRALE